MKTRLQISTTKCLSLGLLVLLSVNAPVDAAPIVIFDSGNALPLTTYFKGIKLNTASQAYPPARVVNANTPVTASERQQILANLFPVRTPELTPGLVKTKVIQLPSIVRPVFMVGVDALSLQWLQQHKARLVALNAKGLVVNVATAAQFDALKQGLSPLEIAAYPGREYAKQFALSHYPVLISASRVEQ